MKRALLGGLLVVTLAPSCAEERPVINRVQPNTIEKTYLDGEWYFQTTVVEVPAAVTPGIVGDSRFPNMQRIRWDIQEHTLYAHRSYELIQNSDGDNGDMEAEVPVTEDGRPYMGAIVAAFAIESQFDIVRRYNETTGEEINVIEENTVDRPWYEREFLRVDWSQNLVTDFTFYGDDEIDAASVPYYVQENGGNPDDRPVFEDSYFDVTTQLAVTPGSLDVEWWPTPVPMCWFFYQEDEECSTSLIKIRNSFLRVDPARQYEIADYKGKITEAFGFFWTDRLHNEQHNGVRETDRRRYVNRHNLWQASWTEDADGNRTPIPFAERQVRPIVYYLNADWPEELLETAQDVAGQWNVAFRDVVMQQTGWSEAETPEVFILCPNNPVAEGDPAECGAAGTHPRIGDLRYSMIYWVRDWYDGVRLLGMGPSNSDPLTGEIFSGLSYIYLYNDQVATDIEEMVRLMNGEIDPFDFINGVDLSRWVEGAAGEGDSENESYSQEDVESMYQAMDVGWTRRLPRGDGRFLPAKGLGREDIGAQLSALQRMGAFDPSRDSGDALLTQLRGTPIENMLVNSEMRMAGGFAPESTLTDEIIESAAITRGNFLDVLNGIERWRLDLGRRAMDVAEFSDDAMYSLAEELKGLPSEEIWDIAREKIISAVLAHEIGHSVGLMHNFGGSEDVMNYPLNDQGDSEYWRLRTSDYTVDPQPRYLSPEPFRQEELDAGIYQYAYSSIMDYSGKIHLDAAGVGRYDRAAVMYGYTGMVEVFEDRGSASEVDLNDYWLSGGSHLRFEQTGPRAFHYTEWYRLMGDRMWRQDNRRLVPASELSEDLSYWESEETGERLARVPYVYCSHNRVNISANCLTRDVGADPYERMYHGLQGLNTWYIMRAFPRSEYGFSPETYIMATYARNYRRLKGFNDIYALYNGLLPTFYTDDQLGTFFTDPTTGWGNYTVAIHDAFNQLARTLTYPDVNDYQAELRPDGNRVLEATGFGGGEPLDVTQGRFFTTSWSDTNFEDDCGYYFWECLHHVGFYLDKVMALLAMSDANTYFVARDTAEDIRQWRISFYDNYSTQITELVGGIVAEDAAQIAPYLNPETGDYYLRDYADPALDPIGDEPPAGTSPVDPYAGFTVQLYAAVLGAARFHNNFDNRFSDSIRMWVAGTGQTFEAPTVSYTDPWNGQTFVALAVERGIAARLVARANNLKARSPQCNDVDELAPDACIVGLPGAQRDDAERELVLIKDNLDVLVDITGAMDSSGGPYADPFDPGG